MKNSAYKTRRKIRRLILHLYLGILMVIFAVSMLICLLFCVKALPSYSQKQEYTFKQTNCYYQYNSLDITYTRAEAKRKIDALFGNPFHFYSEKKFAGITLGETWLMFDWIRMSSDCSIDDYIFSYAHELVHLTERVANERYTNYKAFIKLYESGDEQFKAVAERYLYWDLRGCSLESYTCGYYILEYLNSKE